MRSIKSSNKREKFFDEALKLIHKKGFKGTTMRDIAEKMGFEVANVYNYIDSKQALLDTFFFQMEAEYHNNIDNISASSYSPKEKLRAIISFLVQLPAQKPYVASLLFNEWRNLKPRRLAEYLVGRKRYNAKLQAIIEAGIKQGELREMNVKIAAGTLLSSLRWLYMEYTMKGSKINPIEMEKQILDFIFKGIEK